MKLRASLIGAWPVSADYLVNGLNVPGSIRTAVDEYRAVGDPIGRFINERCEYAVGGRCPRSLLYDEYSDWCSCEGVSPVTPDRFGKDMVNTESRMGAKDVLKGKMCAGGTAYRLNQSQISPKAWWRREKVLHVLHRCSTICF